ncbi:uncharacterized protein ATNIH1004_000228 [Aspergillus tanneri]|uniref:Alcohol dehydrogenase-like C-terminal domain-containing protein n=2 Tax=Aspergillus tanneri TaxID=1220188 RepID=A0A5M9MZD1_9EURO|nr:uncharacterized protein ATNIH1004_000228 [Aspergillus tanneri]KAA8651346.1 hypothetical protein ATNIH1004_000228 [Aspergillus tanneri]
MATKLVAQETLLSAPQESYVAVGGGLVGVGIVQILELQGAKPITVAEPIERRRQFALECGATHCKSQRKGCHGKSSGCHQRRWDARCPRLSRRGKGNARLRLKHVALMVTIVNIAVWEWQPAVPVTELMYNEVQYTGAALYDEDAFQNVIRALSHGTSMELGQMANSRETASLVTSQINLDEVVEKGSKRGIAMTGTYAARSY